MKPMPPKPSHYWLKRFNRILIVILFGTLLSFYSGVFAQDIDIDPELLNRFNIVEENGQILIEVSMQSLLSLALDRATTVDIIKINKQTE